MNVDTTSLRWFQQVADGVTVTEVSDLEGISQPGVSRALARLEADLGTPLLRRSGRTLRMTQAGAAFKHHVDALLHQLDDGVAAVEQILDPETGTVALAFQVSLATWLVPDLVRSFRVEHPHTQFSLTQVRDDLADAALSSGEVDLVLSTVRAGNNGVQRQHVVSEALRLAVPGDHPLAGRTNARLAQVSADPFLMLRPTSLLRQVCVELCRRLGFEPVVAFEGDDVHTLQGFVAAGLGVALVPASNSVTFDISGPVSYLELTDVYAVREIALAWAVERRLLPAAELFRQHVVERARAGRIAPPGQEPSFPAIDGSVPSSGGTEPST